MKFILLVFVLFVVCKNVNSFVCANFCEGVKCPEEVLCDGKTETLVKLGSTCSCCDACYRVLSETEKCVPRFHGGGAFLAKCHDDLVCGPEGTCVKKT